MTQHYARTYDATVQQQFETAAAALEGILVQDCPQGGDGFVAFGRTGGGLCLAERGCMIGPNW